ncbi:hypothetical protein OSB04_028158, partial [Centaurea solstitialis]
MTSQDLVYSSPQFRTICNISPQIRLHPIHTSSRVLSGSLCLRLLLFIIWVSNILDVIAEKLPPTSQQVSLPSSGIFEPIEISPSVLPHYPFTGKTLPPMYPSFPKTYKPVLTGRCPFNFSSISSIMDKTASDCSQLLAPLVGNVICCPQFASSLHIFQGHYTKSSDSLVLQNTTADDCFSDIVEVLASRGANSSVPAMCSFRSSNLTGGSCPVKDLNTFERTVNTTKLLEACSVIDPLKECCRSVCQPAIVEAAFQVSSSQSLAGENMEAGSISTHVDVLNDCKGVVYSWLSRKLPSEAADSAFRILSACKVNKVCPLEFKQPVEVVKACRNVAAPSPSCCSSLNSYIAGVQKQMLITNRQAIICASVFGSMLRKAGILTDVYELCDVDLKDFSLQGCLLRSLPADVVYDNSSGFSFTCDLSDNIVAPWPSSSSMASFSLCAPGADKGALSSVEVES